MDIYDIITLDIREKVIIMKVNVIGLGYIGLPTCLMLASNGHQVVGSDNNERIVNSLQHGSVTFEESGLVNLYEKALDNKIVFDTAYSNDADMYIITVPTPYDSNTKKIDPKYLISAVERVVKEVTRDAILVVESTVSPGTLDMYVRPLLENTEFKLDLVHAPERILPGAMIDELINNPRTIGADSMEIGEVVRDVYKSFCIAEIVVTTINVAEMSKVVENTFRDINIAFANELAQICNAADLDVYEVIMIANKHPRVNILSPGPGVGGHCISVDPWFLVGDYPDLTKLILSARNTNDSMPKYILSRVKEIMNKEGISDFSKVGVYGITYKENVDDVRESPTLQLNEILEGEEKNIKFFDPFVKTTLLDNQEFDFDAFQNDIEMMVVFVNHHHLDTVNLKKELIIFDTRNTKLSGDRVFKL